MEIRILAVLIVFVGIINLLRMAIFLIGSDIYALLLNRRKQKAFKRIPVFSVIIPAHNEEQTIVRAVQSVVDNDYPDDKKEIVVVDDGSTDATAVNVQRFIRSHKGVRIILVRQSNLGKASALNNGIKGYSTGDLIMCLDADSYLDQQALRKAQEHFNDASVVAMSANVKILRRPGILNLIQVYEYLICYQMKRAESLFRCEYIIGGIGSVFRRSILKKVGYYDTNTVTEDIDVTMKILQHGNKQYRVIYGSDVVAYTEAVLSISSLIGQRYRWKWGRCQTFLKNLNLFFSRKQKYTRSLTWFYLPFAIYGDIAYFIEPILFAYIVAISLYYHDPRTILGAWSVISFYVLMNVLAEDTVRMKEKMRLLWAVPLMYILFYVLSFVEYIALLKSLARVHLLRKSLDEGCHWLHVDRPQGQKGDYIWSFKKVAFGTVLLSIVVFAAVGLFYQPQQVQQPVLISPVRSSAAVGPTMTAVVANPVQQPVTVHYVVQRGDNLWNIARRYYGKGSQWNTLQTPDGKTLIHPGEVVSVVLSSSI